MQTALFVYGTLKEAFANADVNGGVRVPGVFETATPFPLYLVGDYYIPWLVDQEGVGLRVLGQLFHTDAQALQRMDELERIGEPGWFSRREILIRPQGSSASTLRSAFVYFGAPGRLTTDTVHLGPVAEFKAEHDHEYRRRAA